MLLNTVSFILCKDEVLCNNTAQSSRDYETLFSNEKYEISPVLLFSLICGNFFMFVIFVTQHSASDRPRCKIGTNIDYIISLWCLKSNP